MKSKMKPPPQVEREANFEWTDGRRTEEEWQSSTCISNNLRSNALRQTGEKPYTCPFCSYRTSRKALLEEHINTHTGDRPFSCPYCQYSSSHKSILKAHIRRHTGEKPYACAHCPYRATQKSTLNSHMLTHKGKDPVA